MTQALDFILEGFVSQVQRTSKFAKMARLPKEFYTKHQHSLRMHASMT